MNPTSPPLHANAMRASDRLISLYESKKADEAFARNEAQVRQSLIAPFFREALGWDIENPDEFKFEKPIAGKRADIIACLDGISQFVIEVKAITHDIFDKVEFYRQAIQYADGLEKRYAVLTNFREWIVLRTDLEARNSNWLTLEVARFTIDQLRVDLGLLGLFRREIWAGDRKELDALDRKFEQSYRRRKLVDERLLELFVAWRSGCLSWLKKNKPRLFDQETSESVEEEVQRYLDRIIFITSCEDREIEDRRLRQFISLYQSSLKIEGHAVTRGIRDIFGQYYSRYDSDLFDKGLADQFEFDDAVTYGILRDIKSPKNELPFDFSVIGPDILGKTYENFIGHLVRGRSRLEEVTDLSKRKQEGIYYTPQWVVEQIVARTLGPYIRGKGLKALREVRVLDPACGSGTFLITAFRELLKQASVAEGRELTYEERKNLFLSSIFGVDKDDRACDIAKLNISLQLAEKGKRLPSLSKNILCGDSLVAREVDGYPKGMRWQDRFPEIFSRENPGFDVIVGNPPYLGAKDFDDSTKYADILRSEFGELKDLYNLFIRLNDRLVRDGGSWGFVVPNTFFTLTNYRDIREMLRARYNSLIIDLSPNVFKDAYVFNAILIASRTRSGTGSLSVAFLEKESTGRVDAHDLSYGEIARFPKLPFFAPTELYEKHDKRILVESGRLFREFETELSNDRKRAVRQAHISAHMASLRPGDTTLLGVACEGSQGLVTGNNSRYLGVLPADESARLAIWNQLNSKLAQRVRGFQPLQWSRRNAESLYAKAEELKARDKAPTLFGKKFLYKTVEPQSIREYSTLTPAERREGVRDSSRPWILYFRGNEDGEVWRVRSPEYICWTKEFVNELRGGTVTNSRWQGESYFFKPGFGWVDYFDERIKGFYVEPTLYSKNVVKFHSPFFPDEYVLGLLNSSYVSYYVKRYITNTRTLQVNDGKLIPIVKADTTSTEDVTQRVRTILDLKRDLLDSRNERDRIRIGESLRMKERDLDDRVFSLYGLDPVRDIEWINRIREGNRKDRELAEANADETSPAPSGG
jgi:hypothetical protein